MCVPAPSNPQPWARGHTARRLGAPLQLAFSVLQRGGRWLLRVSRGFVASHPWRRRRDSVAGARLAEAMVRYAELCMASGRRRDIKEAAQYLDSAASLYMQVGRAEDAAKALALKSGSGAGMRNDAPEE